MPRDDLGVQLLRSVKTGAVSDKWRPEIPGDLGTLK